MLAIGAVLSSIGGMLGMGIISVMAFGPGIGNRFRNILNSWFDGNLPASEQIVLAYNKGEISIDDYYAMMKPLGFSRDCADFILKVEKILLPMADVLTLWYRYKNEPNNAYGVTPQWFQRKLLSLGVPEAEISTYVESQRPIPNIQDVIRFAVREVYSPEQVKLGQLDLEMPDEYIVEAEKRGLSRDDALAYWRSHWEVPSPQMAFEMYHRLYDNPDPETVFGDKELQTFFDVADYAPGYRKRMTAIAYQPLTRVDVRRIHALGIFGTGDEAFQKVKRAYREEGYNDENAEIMAKFTVAINQEEQKDATRSQIEQFWTSGALGHDRNAVALKMLTDLGYSQDTAEMMIRQLEIKEITAEEENQIDQIEHKYIIGELKDKTSVINELTKMELSPAQIKKYANSIESSKNKSIHRMTVSEANRLVTCGLMTKGEYVDTLKGLGYRENDATRLYRAASRSDLEQIIRPTKADFIQWYTTDLINGVEFYTRMRELGYSDDDISKYAIYSGKPLEQ